MCERLRREKDLTTPSRGPSPAVASTCGPACSLRPEFANRRHLLSHAPRDATLPDRPAAPAPTRLVDPRLTELRAQLHDRRAWATRMTS
ncbi:hypothetical protein [Nannocystis radixulma]|uniref:Uncharacterized protein n=1 Tax=Nannocystis radixulma TaxID=2995305 RepID=A0ABT5BG33_9BACT|nr:hypothetical protein [Nannocystis radixulma]MDC0672678.1 hypothetical protein [Nannocystis radixulma]